MSRGNVEVAIHGPGRQGNLRGYVSMRFLGTLPTPEDVSDQANVMAPIVVDGVSHQVQAIEDSRDGTFWVGIEEHYPSAQKLREMAYALAERLGYTMKIVAPRQHA